MDGFDKEFTSEKAFYDEREDTKESEQYKKIFNQFWSHNCKSANLLL